MTCSLSACASLSYSSESTCSASIPLLWLKQLCLNIYCEFSVKSHFVMRAFFYSSLGYSAAGLCKCSSLPLACAIVCKKFSGDRHRQRKRFSRHKGRSEPNLPSQVRRAQCLSAAWTFNSLWNYSAEIWHKFNTFFATLRLSLSSVTMAIWH